MSYKLINNWLPKNRYHIKAPNAMTPIGICIHETDNNATARNEIAYMIRNNNYTSFHVAIDENEVVQSIPFNRNAWAAGDGANGVGNRRYLHFEICRNKDNGYAGPISARLEQAYENTALYTAYVLKQYGWGTDVLRQHYDFTRKNCPRKIRKFNRWNWFKGRVQHHLDRLNNVANSTPKNPAKVEVKPKENKEDIDTSDNNQKIALEVALSDLKMTTNEWNTQTVNVNGSFKVGGTRIMSRFGSPNLNSSQGGYADPGYTLEFDQIAIAGDHAWLRYRVNDRIKYLPFATKDNFSKGQYWGTFE